MKSRFLEGSLNPFDLIRFIRFKRNFLAEHPEYFEPEGLLVFCGAQGAGKTLSAVQYCLRLLPHRALICL